MAKTNIDFNKKGKQEQFLSYNQRKIAQIDLNLKPPLHIRSTLKKRHVNEKKSLMERASRVIMNMTQTSDKQLPTLDVSSEKRYDHN